jgi:hypothetical protein
MFILFLVLIYPRIGYKGPIFNLFIFVMDIYCVFCEVETEICILFRRTSVLKALTYLLRVLYKC